MIRCSVTDCPNLIMGPGATGGSSTLKMCWDCIDRAENEHESGRQSASD